MLAIGNVPYYAEIIPSTISRREGRNTERPAVPTRTL